MLLYEIYNRHSLWYQVQKWLKTKPEFQKRNIYKYKNEYFPQTINHLQPETAM
jgi:hypothetical protein